MLWSLVEIGNLLPVSCLILTHLHCGNCSLFRISRLPLWSLSSTSFRCPDSPLLATNFTLLSLLFRFHLSAIFTRALHLLSRTVVYINLWKSMENFYGNFLKYIISRVSEVPWHIQSHWNKNVLTLDKTEPYVKTLSGIELFSRELNHMTNAL